MSMMLSATALGQDLDRLQQRAERLLSLRSANNKGQAVQYIEPQGREEFLQSRPLPMLEPRLTGLEFTDDPKLVYVIFKAKVVLPDIGPVPRTGRELWIWDRKDWYLRLETGPAFPMTSKDTPQTSAPQPIPLEIEITAVDLGSLTQGDVVKGKVSFKSKRDEIFLFRTPDNLPGLAFGIPVWLSDEIGDVEFVLDTALLSQDVRYHVEFQVDGPQGQKTRSSFELSATIAPRLRISQSPQLLDPQHAGTVEVQIQNLSDTSFRFLETTLTNQAYKITNELPQVVSPGDTIRITISYPAQENPSGAQIHLRLSEEVIVGRRNLTLPLQIKFPVTVVPEFTQQQLEQILRRNR